MMSEPAGETTMTESTAAKTLGEEQPKWKKMGWNKPGRKGPKKAAKNKTASKKAAGKKTAGKTSKVLSKKKAKGAAKRPLAATKKSSPKKASKKVASRAVSVAIAKAVSFGARAGDAGVRGLLVDAFKASVDGKDFAQARQILDLIESQLKAK